MQGMFFEVAAEGLWCHVSLFGYIFQRDGFVILLHDVVVNSPDADAFVFAVGCGLSAGGQGLQFLEGAQLFEQLDEMDQLVYACAILDPQHFCRDLGCVLGWYFEAGLLILEEVL